MEEERISETDHDLNESEDNMELLKGARFTIGQTMLIDDLQIQLTKLQIQCLEERRNYLGLVGDNEQLTLEKEELRRKFQAALLLGRLDEQAVVHFLQKNPKAAELTDEIIKVKEDILKCDGQQKSIHHLDNPVVLQKQVVLLQKQLEDRKKQNLVEIFGLKTSLELTFEEREMMKEQYDSRLKEVVNNLEETKNLIHTVTQENLKLKKKMLQIERQKEKDQKKLVQQLAEASGASVFTDDSHNVPAVGGNQANRNKHVPPLQSHLLEKLTRAEIKVMEKENTVKEYELKFLQMEKKIQRAKEQENSAKRTCSEMIRKLRGKNESMEKRFNKLDERRKLDNSGFREDIKALRQLLSSIERKVQLFMYRRIASDPGTTEPPPSENPPKPPSLLKGSHSPPERDWCSGSGMGVVVKERGKMKNILKPKNTVDTAAAAAAAESPIKDVKEERRDSREELERDKLIYEMLCKVLSSAKIRMNDVEKEILQQI